MSQEPPREGEDGGRKGGSSSQAVEFHLSQSNGQLLSRTVLSGKGPRVDASVFERSLWCSGGGTDCRDQELSRRGCCRKPCGVAELGQILVRFRK